MPATARQIERYWTEPPDDEPEQTCPECGGSGGVECIDSTVATGGLRCVCGACDGTGTVPYEPDPDRDYDAMVDREMER